MSADVVKGGGLRSEKETLTHDARPVVFFFFVLENTMANGKPNQVIQKAPVGFTVLGLWFLCLRCTGLRLGGHSRSSATAIGGIPVSEPHQAGWDHQIEGLLCQAS